ncbi:DUF3160 domain-containing protein [Pelagicoccus sp. SDUM812003]|uniref:DUF3160 domain-containing protein n=1 Tax=Pelagicoccus sp. SDUM812003 TaxID=3041267 RepID=UPI00280D62B0|nr:DUF3160 domain-containing protein [Pelagicoccus sp. SDUM812003]MDQ8204105.1 DUF3160 domain-containing protein [Pelagicoccus sp. SDUM812003]
MPRLLALLTVLLFSHPSPHLPAGEPPPPEPKFQPADELSREEWRAAHDRWQAEHDAWENQLTAQQVIELQKAKRAENSAEQEGSIRNQSLPTAASDYDWRVEAEKRKLSSALLDSLENHQLAYGDSCRQSFAPYLSGPVFITSDSLLNAFHVLFEDSFRELELRRAESFRGRLAAVLAAARSALTTAFSERLPGEAMPADRFEAAFSQVELALGPALILMGEPLESFSEIHRQEIAAQVQLITQADSQILPSWLAPADPESLLAIDYRRCRPVGFYADSPRLQNYFRALRWLQMLPFRASREHEFDAMALLAIACDESKQEGAFARYTQLLGRGDDPTMIELGKLLDFVSPRSWRTFDCRRPEVRKRVSLKLIQDGYYRINSDLRAKTTVVDAFPKLVFRIVSTAALPDAITFQEMLDQDLAPSGLAVAAWLGSEYALENLAPAERSFIEANPKPAQDPFDHYDRYRSAKLYPRYLDVLSTLFIPAAPEAPDFMRREAWAAKSCQSALGSWAQMRHTFTLQAKMTQHYLGLALVPPGFVEPNPEFFARMARLIETSHNALEAEKCFQPSRWEESDRLRELALFLQKPHIVAPAIVKLLGFDSSWEDFLEMQSVAEAVSDPSIVPSSGLDDDDPDYQAKRLRAIEILEAKAEAIESGATSIPQQRSILEDRWEKLAKIARQLESLAHKQLRQLPWSHAEEAFLKEYGEKLAYVMGYFGNSWLTPRDDAPRWAEVVGYPERQRSLSAAVGRPRTFYVLYPWQGLEILCQGSVMQYYEFETDTTLTDQEWKTRLDSPNAPVLPEWIQPYASTPAAPPPDPH